MDEALMQQLLDVMTEAGLPEDSSQEIAFHLALHFPMHAQALLAHVPTDPDDTPSGEDTP